MSCIPDKDEIQKGGLTLREVPSQSLLVMPFCFAVIGLVVVTALSQDSIPAGAAIILIFLSLAGAGLYLSYRMTLNIDPACGSITKTWRIAYLSVKRSYQLRDYRSVQIREKETPLEGHSLSRYTLYLAGNSRSVKLFETSDPAEAEKVRENIETLMIR